MPEVITYTKLPMDLLNPVWDMYEAAMRPLRKLALQKHVMHTDEFVHLMADTRAVKFLGVNDRGDASGLAVSMGTDQLAAWPYIEPEYLEHNWPAAYAAKRIWYTGFTVTTRREVGLFGQLLSAVSAPVRAIGGMSFMDFCEHNEESGLPEAAATIAGREDPRLHYRRVDGQGYWIFSYDDSESPV